MIDREREKVFEKYQKKCILSPPVSEMATHYVDIQQDKNTI